MTHRTITVIIILVSIAVWVGWDIYVAFFNKERGDTISAVIGEFASKSIWHLIASVGAVFLLCGHWFWGLKDRRIK